MNRPKLCAPCVIGQVIFLALVGWAIYHFVF
jgi:hypothetical protein